MTKHLLSSVLFAVLAGCAGSGHVAYHAEVQASVPNLVEISPGVQVVADADAPIFYSDASYWRYDNGTWYRSQWHDHGWARVDVVPERIRLIDRPSAYVHFHGTAHATIEPRDQTNVNVIEQPERTEVIERQETIVPERRDDQVLVPERHETVVVQPESAHDLEKDADEQHKRIEENRKDAKEQRKDNKEMRKQAKEQRKEDKKVRKELEHERHD